MDEDIPDPLEDADWDEEEEEDESEKRVIAAFKKLAARYGYEGRWRPGKPGRPPVWWTKFVKKKRLK